MLRQRRGRRPTDPRVGLELPEPAIAELFGGVWAAFVFQPPMRGQTERYIPRR
jgi:hypothetical protein